MTIQRVPFLIIVFLVIIVVVPLGIIWPSVKQIRSTSQMIYQEYQFLEDRSQRSKNIKQAKKEYEELRTHLPALRALAIEPNEELKFITAVEALAEANRVTEKINLDVDKPRPAGNYNALPMELTISGSYRDVVKYLAALRNIQIVTTLSNISLVSGRTTDALGVIGQNSDIKIEARLTGVVYEHKNN
ncbi:hypothetical protein A3H10_01870 [Candidatus Uhrbacteria bacterium RIFCSPLOWO2_12_FULL_46_10]|uniref:Pilus assembly protein PilO n=1 Tax=Candidatus Uhrbacteria bacterium RIFCSPLOWO2_01_FULL_47_25 TaxID=1802402 RepID=A0A1F7UPQ2_9BACT|nr:MAG: hypothetical protein UX68_C0039G0006 [Parcubacteria group bacterium GW2011_GWA2_46_9]OGL60971.1 MAG: hypothetical protein A2752_00555 [Candidatus Uhrbacteria bacterium RIFCSPHIGHO2_01_FULL_46_23]OGL69183.1 MAG: hypothetical protein A3D60_04760 [Candidatus Uhrbacteria bacterium RIFCSPHIGHO2_02_FULL_47_29]OGL75314.1 MAG: hypothetical protein A3E96_01450 [Candidatus Uhrbacteria bacterium RIFCSPHIGHO2_12_FULL_46_13]OGL80246.1 MAG: hypothetical protein A2936_02665 [Candidatus Uhrbacteria bac